MKSKWNPSLLPSLQKEWVFTPGRAQTGSSTVQLLASKVALGHLFFSSIPRFTLLASFRPSSFTSPISYQCQLSCNSARRRKAQEVLLPVAGSAEGQVAPCCMEVCRVRRLPIQDYFLMVLSSWNGKTAPGAAPVQSCASGPLHVPVSFSPFS